MSERGRGRGRGRAVPPSGDRLTLQRSAQEAGLCDQMSESGILAQVLEENDTSPSWSLSNLRSIRSDDCSWSSLRKVIDSWSDTPMLPMNRCSMSSALQPRCYSWNFESGRCLR